MLRKVIQAGETFENSRTGTRLEARESTPERVVFDRRYPPNTGRADPHVHFDITQSWEVLSGEARVVVDGETRAVKAGQTVEIPTGVPHQDIHNPHTSDLSVRWTVAPVNDFVEAFADCYTHYLTRDELDEQDEYSIAAVPDLPCHPGSELDHPDPDSGPEAGDPNWRLARTAARLPASIRRELTMPSG